MTSSGSMSPSGPAVSGAAAISRYPHLKSINLGLCNWSGSAELAVNPFWSMVLAVKQPWCEFGSTSTSSKPSAPPVVPGGEGGSSSCSVHTKSGTVSMEARRYFDLDGTTSRRGFASARLGTSKNVGVALGLSLSEDACGALTVHVGAYTNLSHPTEINPTLGVSFAWSSF
jgi:hypothetical protein